MEILQERDLARYLFNQYTINPKNWNFIISTSPVRNSFFDALISNSNEVWQLKIDSLYKPNPMIMGAKVDNDPSKLEKKISNTSHFGYRSLETSTIMNFLKNLSEEQNNNSVKDDDINIRLHSLLSSLEPVKPIRGKNYLCGPFIFTEKKLKFDNSHDKISETISSKMKEKLRRKYSSYG
jgi:hypothetical protein